MTYPKQIVAGIMIVGYDLKYDFGGRILINVSWVDVYNAKKNIQGVKYAFNIANFENSITIGSIIYFFIQLCELSFTS